MKDAATRLTALLQEIEAAGISVITEDMGTIFLMRGRRDDQEFTKINDYTGLWEITSRRGWQE